jgi:hypothetical protein
MDDTDFKVQVATALGRIEQKIDGHTLWMQKHVEDDAKIAVDVQALKETRARQRGVIAAVAAIGSVLSATIATAVTLITKGH